MSRCPKESLRPLTEQERQALQRILRSGSERADVVTRAREVLAVTLGASYRNAAAGAGRRSAEAVSKLVSRFNREGLAALEPHGRGGPMPGQSWAGQGQARRQPHEYVRNGTAKLLTLFCPNSGELRAKGVTAAPNAVLHPWLQQELTAVLDRLPAAAPVTDAAGNHAAWEQWQRGLKIRITLPAILPALRLLLVWDNLKGHLTPTLVLWLFIHGVMPLYTPLSGSWLNMAESIQRIIGRRALAGQYLQTAQQIIDTLEATVKGWNRDPTPFHWGGKRHARRLRSRQRQHALAGSGACTRRPLRRRPSALQKSLSSCQVTH